MTKKKEDDWTFVHINLDTLDLEWQKQIPLYAEWSRRLARRRMRVAELEAKAKVLTAELKRISALLDQRIRARPAKYGIKRVTDTAIKETITLQKEFQKAQQHTFDHELRIVRAKYGENLVEAACRTIYQRKESLQDQVRMMLAEHNSEPRVPKGNQEERRAFKKRTMIPYKSRGRKK